MEDVQVKHGTTLARIDILSITNILNILSENLQMQESELKVFNRTATLSTSWWGNCASSSVKCLWKGTGMNKKTTIR